MYITVVWRAFPGASTTQEIEQDVHRALGTFKRCALWPGVVLVAARSPAALNEVDDGLVAVEALHGAQFSYSILVHEDGARFRTSEPFDEQVAREIIRA